MYSYYNHWRPLYDEEIFVFGSNTKGIHGAGAAKIARMKYGAKLGIGKGLIGRSYAIPTKDDHIQTLPIRSIVPFIHEFVQFTQRNTNLWYYVTPVGCGLASYKPSDIAEHFKDAVNCSFDISFKQYLES